MRIVLAHNWWSLVLRGVIAILLGLVTFAWPGITLGGLVLLFGAYALVGGIISIIVAVRASGANERWGALLIEGMAGIAAAAITIAWPAITAFALVCVIAAWAIVTGVLEIIASVQLRMYIRGEWLLAVSGVASVLFGALIFAAPLAGELILAIWFGAYALVFGAFLVALGFRLRSWTRTRTSGSFVEVPVH